MVGTYFAPIILESAQAVSLINYLKAMNDHNHFLHPVALCSDQSQIIGHNWFSQA